MQQKRGSYTPEFREMAIQLALSSGKPISHTARELEMNPDTLREWVQAHKKASPLGTGYRTSTRPA